MNTTKTQLKTQLNIQRACKIVDAQTDFMTGSLALKYCPAKEDGEEIVPFINQIIDDNKKNNKYKMIIFTYDYHPKIHCSFIDDIQSTKIKLKNKEKDPKKVKLFETVTLAKTETTPEMEQIMWPRHCVQGTEGSKLHKNIKFDNKLHTAIFKGTNKYIDSYSGFWDNGKKQETNLHKILQKNNITHLDIGGLATDVCVKATALHGIEHGYKVTLLRKICRGVDKDNIKLAIKEMKEANILIN